jgi:prepilin-type N-terminal cleavage/methylation domain-containing protein
MSNMSSNKGFTLIEIMVTLGISLVMILAIYAVINSAQRSSAGLERRVAAQQDEKAALELMTMEIRMASFNPNFTADIWLDPADCFNASANQTYGGIQIATANSITIEMDINESSVIGDVENEIIRYNYDAVNQLITRQTRRPPPGACSGAVNQPLLGSTTAGQKTVNVINNTLGIPVFRYFNGAGAQIAAPVTAEIPNIRRIEITLAVETENVDPNTKTRKRIIYTTSVIVRNHAPAL